MVQELEDDDDGSEPKDLKRLLRCVAALVLTTLEGIRLIKPERTAAKGPAQTIPPVLPVDIGMQLPVEFLKIGSAHKERYENFMGLGTIDDVCKDYRSLRGCVALDREPMLKNSDKRQRAGMDFRQHGSRLACHLSLYFCLRE
jgi:hypothetical protein